MVNEMAAMGNGLFHLPFCELRGRGAHEFGCLRLWIKKKSFADLTTWEELKWRPLVSFRKHRWRKLFSLLSRW